MDRIESVVVMVNFLAIDHGASWSWSVPAQPELVSEHVRSSFDLTSNLISGLKLSTYDMESEIFKSGGLDKNKGILLVTYELKTRDEWGEIREETEEHKGTVCAENFSYDVADYFCELLGYTVSQQWSFTEDKDQYHDQK